MDGFYFPDETVAPLLRQTPDQFVVAPRRPFHAAERESGAATLEVSFRHAAGEHVLVGGGGAWESEGFVALARGDAAWLWILYIEAGEAFTRAWLEADALVAQSGGYPERCTYRISPLGEPSRVEMRRERD